MQGLAPGLALSVAQAFLDACRLELDALKPGNVHRYAEGHGMTVADFEASARCAAPAIARTAAGVGERVRLAVEATQRAVGKNTNLGILLLCAPMAEAVWRAGSAADLARATRQVLEGLDLADARAVYAAIRLARPGGLGRSPRHDAAAEPEVGLLQAMREAAAWDRIAWNYAHGFADIFARGLPWWRQAIMRGRTPVWACAEVYLRLLAALPDTHIARKFGRERAEAVRLAARPLAARLVASTAPDGLLPQLYAFDAELKAQGLNPGTTADLTVATVFAAKLIDRLAALS